MTREEMRERVAEIIRKGAIYPRTSDELADAAIAIIRGETLEEAAKLVEGLPVFTFHERNVLTKGEYTTTHTCAAAIRALKDKP